jgi:hypothetical protein
MSSIQRRRLGLTSRHMASSLIATETIRDSYGGPVNMSPRWLRIPSAVAYSGIPRATLYRLLATGSIRTSLIKQRNSNRGIRLVDRLSVDHYIESLNQPETPETGQ